MANQMKLTASNVTEIYDECCTKESETGERIKIEGVQTIVEFSSEKIEKRKEDIISMLGDLPEDFFVGKGGGWSFLNMCVTKDGELWTGMHPVVDMLVCLGLAVGKMSFLMDRDMWELLPGAVPYIVIEQ